MGSEKTSVVLKDQEKKQPVSQDASRTASRSPIKLDLKSKSKPEKLKAEDSKTKRALNSTTNSASGKTPAVIKEQNKKPSVPEDSSRSTSKSPIRFDIKWRSKI